MDTTNSVRQDPDAVQSDVRARHVQRLRWIHHVHIVGAGQRNKVDHRSAL